MGGMDRRTLLQAGLAAGAALGTGAWASGCDTNQGTHSGPSGSPRPTGSPGPRGPGSLPYPHLAAGTDTIPQIKHIVVMMMENHSYDNHLGMLRRNGADGFTLGPDGKPTATNPYPDGKIQHAFRMPTTCQLSGKPSQTWTTSHVQFANGKLNGFVSSASGPVSMGYWQQADLPFYYSLASTYPIADRYFASLLGPTFPNRRYLMAATSMGMIRDSVPNPLDYPDNGTIFDALDKVGVSWTDYYSALGGFLAGPTMGLFPKLLSRDENIRRMEHFFADAKAGTLPGFCIVEPDFLSSSEENPHNIANGENFAFTVIEAVTHGPAWKNTLLIWTFDEHGGYYDHVVPPRAVAPDDIGPDTLGVASPYTGFTQYGFRLPCAIISPWAKPNYVSHQVFDHTSICALVEAKWNLPAMTHRDARANNMLDMLDLSRPAFLNPPTLAKPLLVSHPQSAVACGTTGPGTIPPPGSVSGP
jgi:phospholipase C